MKTLSVIVPTYNVEAYLGKCLDSLLVNSEKLEVLVIIDGSKDRSCEIARNYHEKYPNIFRVIEKENGHYGSCVNMGLSQAQGRFVKLLDSDDYFDSGFEEYLSFLENAQADVVFTDFISVNEKDSILYKSKFCKSEKVVEGCVEDLIKYGTQLVYHYELTYRTDFLKEMNYRQTEGISYTDLEWSTLPFSRIQTYIYYPRYVYKYLKGRSGQSIDITYRKKNMWMENKVVMGLVRQYESLKNVIPSANETILRTFVFHLVRNVYLHYLINFRRSLDISELKTFDKELLGTSETIYKLAGEIVDIRKYGSFPFVKDFRNNFFWYNLKYTYYDLFRYAGALIDHIRTGKKGPIFIDNVH